MCANQLIDISILKHFLTWIIANKACKGWTLLVGPSNEGMKFFVFVNTYIIITSDKF